jgi:hypothetical protein
MALWSENNIIFVQTGYLRPLRLTMTKDTFRGLRFPRAMQEHVPSPLASPCTRDLVKSKRAHMARRRRKQADKIHAV